MLKERRAIVPFRSILKAQEIFMPTVTETDLKELKDLITIQSDQIADIQNQFINFQTHLIDLKISIEKIEATFQAQQLYLQKMPDLMEEKGFTFVENSDGYEKMSEY